MLITMSSNNREIVYEGWLTKSPPSKRIWKARWRRRWFVLRHSGELPGQFFLQYYTDRNCRKLKGTIDLDQCEQVDAGLRFENSKQNYPHMFDVKTPKRTYYLAAESESDMNKWVDCVCQVCGLKAATDYSSVEFTEVNNDALISPSENTEIESPPISPRSTVSGPYISMSECVTGKPLNTPLGISEFNNIISRQGLIGSASSNRITSKDSCLMQPKSQSKLNNIQQTICSDDISKCDKKSVTLVMSMPKTSVDRPNSLYKDKNLLASVKTKNEDHSNSTKITNIESAKKMAELKNHGRRPPDLKLMDAISDDFYDRPRKIVVDISPTERRPAPVPMPNWETFPNADGNEEVGTPTDIDNWNMMQQFRKLAVVDYKVPTATNSLNRNTKQKIRPATLSLRRTVAPPRPPKPSHLIIQESTHNYLNLEEKSNENKASSDAGNVNTEAEESVSPASGSQSTPVAPSDEMYDIPRSHQPQNEEGPVRRNNYSNAAPSELTGDIFRYDFTDADNLTNTAGNLGEPISPRSEGSGSGVIYSNVSTPLLGCPGTLTPPAVNRELKPTRKMSDSGASNEPSPGGPFTSLNREPSPGGPFSFASCDPPMGGPPSIDRTLKPKKLQSEGFRLSKPHDGSLSLRRVRAGPSPVPQDCSAFSSNIRNGRTASEYSSSEEDPRRSPESKSIYHCDSKSSKYTLAKKSPEIQYLDLDLDSDVGSLNNTTTQPAVPTTTVYKTVDFLKTEAFNRTRQEVEEERNKLPAE